MQTRWGFQADSVWQFRTNRRHLSMSEDSLSERILGTDPSHTNTASACCVSVSSLTFSRLTYPRATTAWRTASMRWSLPLAEPVALGIDLRSGPSY